MGFIVPAWALQCEGLLLSLLCTSGSTELPTVSPLPTFFEAASAPQAVVGLVLPGFKGFCGLLTLYCATSTGSLYILFIKPRDGLSLGCREVASAEGWEDCWRL